jgi:hypothetical protein
MFDYDEEDEIQDAKPLEFMIYSSTALDVILRDGEIKSVTSEHPNFLALREALLEDAQALSDEDVRELIDFAFTIGQKLETLSERVKFDGSNVFFDGDAIHSTLSDQIVRMAKEKNPRLTAMVKFLENLSQNPSEASRNSLFDWIENLRNKGEELTITKEGMILAYKGVMIDSEGISRSISAGPGIIDGVAYRGHLPNREGSVIEIARSYVDANVAVGCSRGLHAGTWAYAHSFARGRTLKVEINPRDVVSVPADCAWQKLRVSRYVVLEETDAPETLPVYAQVEEWSEEELDAWLEAGYDSDEAEDFMDRGFSYEEALDAVEEEEVDIEAWLAEGFDEEDVDYYRGELDLTLEEAIEARNEMDDDEAAQDERYAEWLAKGFTVEQADGWMGIGYSVEEALADISEEDSTTDGECEDSEEDSEEPAETHVVEGSFVDAFTAPKKSKKGKKNKKKNKKSEQ